MYTTEFNGVTYTYPQIIPAPAAPDIEMPHPVFMINEGEFSGVRFHIYDIHFDEEDVTLLHYMLSVDGAEPNQISDIVNNFLLAALVEFIKNNKEKLYKVITLS